MVLILVLVVHKIKKKISNFFINQLSVVWHIHRKSLNSWILLLYTDEVYLLLVKKTPVNYSEQERYMN